MSSSEACAGPDQVVQDLLWAACSCPPPSARLSAPSSSSRPAGSSSASTPNHPSSWYGQTSIRIWIQIPASFLLFPRSSSFLQDAALTNQTVVGPVLGSSVANLSISNLTEYIEFTVRNAGPAQVSCCCPRVGAVTDSVGACSQSQQVVSCVFWDFSLNGEQLNGLLKSQNGGVDVLVLVSRRRRRLELGRLLPAQRHARLHHLQLRPPHRLRHPAGRCLRWCVNKQQRW